MMFKLDPRLLADTVTLGKLPLCTVLLMNESQFPWVILVPRRESVNEVYQLDNAEQQLLQRESCMLGEALMTKFDGHKLNTAALGNMVAQLHIHHIVRFEFDASWPKPVWGNFVARPYQVKELKRLCAELKTTLSRQSSDFVAA